MWAIIDGDILECSPTGKTDAPESPAVEAELAEGGTAWIELCDLYPTRKAAQTRIDRDLRSEFDDTARPGEPGTPEWGGYQSRP